MRSIRLKEVPVKSSQVQTTSQEGFILKYREEYLRMVEIHPEGITVPQMKSAIRVIDALQKAGTDSLLVLEDADWEYLKTRAENHKFGLAAAELVEMVEAVTNAEKYDAPHKRSKDTTA